MPVRVRQEARDLPEPCGPGDTDERRRGESDGDRDRECDLPPAVLAVVARDVFVQYGFQHPPPHTRPGHYVALSA
jgi:hypothetical protein